MADVPKTSQEQLDILISRKLVIDVPNDQVKSFLEQNNYYRFRGYFINFCKIDPVSSNEEFDGVTTFSDIRDIYECDSLFRRSIRDLLEVNEIFLRTVYTYFFSNYSKDAYFLYDDQYFYFNALRDSKIHNVRKSVKRLIDFQSKSLIVKRYTDKVTKICKLPSWAFIEFMTFGDISQLYEATDSNFVEILNHDHFRFAPGAAHNYLTSWTKSLAKLRNICHHYERLYSKDFLETPPKIFNDHVFQYHYNMNTHNSTKLFSIILISVILCPDKNVVQSFISSINALILKYPKINFDQAYGFPSDWETIIRNLSGYLIK
jgi:abortive infection bacteriophage resistance protein